MRPTGIVRKIDELGRIVLPAELRSALSLEPRDSLEIYVDGEQIVLKKYEPSCIFCGEADEVITFRNKRICRECLKKVRVIDFDDWDG